MLVPFSELKRLDLITIKRSDMRQPIEVLIHEVDLELSTIVFRYYSQFTGLATFCRCDIRDTLVIDSENGATIEIIKGNH